MIKGICLCIALLGLDLISKIAALHWVPFFQGGSYPFGGIPLFQNFLGISFSLNTIVNTGAAWGMLSGHSTLLFVLRFLLIVGVGGYFLLFGKKWLKRPLFWIISAGAVGNVIDYLLYGYVVDFFHLVFWGYSFPIFNLADAYISIGVFCLFFFSSRSRAGQEV